jgi:hypothetical protein
MQVTADIRRSDLVNLNLYVYPRHRNTYIIFALFVVIGLAIPLVHDGKFSSQGLLLGLAIGVAMGLIMVVFTFLICVLGQALSSPKNTGRLGQRTYNLQDDGFEWAGETGNGKQKWTAISAVTKTRNYAHRHHAQPVLHCAEPRVSLWRSLQCFLRSGALFVEEKQSLSLAGTSRAAARAYGSERPISLTQL